MIRRNIKPSVILYTYERALGEALVKGKTKKNEMPQKRAAFFILMIEFSGMSLTRIGKEMEKDHSTVIHARDNIQYQLKSYYPDIEDALVTARRKLYRESRPDTKTYLKELKQKIKSIQEEVDEIEARMNESSNNE